MDAIADDREVMRTKEHMCCLPIVGKLTRATYYYDSVRFRDIHEVQEAIKRDKHDAHGYCVTRLKLFYLFSCSLRQSGNNKLLAQFKEQNAPEGRWSKADKDSMSTNDYFVSPFAPMSEGERRL